MFDWQVRDFLIQLCCFDGDGGSFTRALAKSKRRWTSVEPLLDESQRSELRRLACRPGGFDPRSLQVHYVLDEDCVNGGRAFVLFALPLTSLVCVVQASNQSRFVPVEEWMKDDPL
jgi:hypothetical protein